MKHLFVTYEIALKLKEKGFDDPCIMHYMIEDSTFEMGSPKVINLKTLVNSQGIETGIKPSEVEFNLCAPTYQQVVDWLRETYKLHIKIDRNYDGWTWFIINFRNGNQHVLGTGNDEFEEYYTALQKAIEGSIKLI